MGFAYLAFIFVSGQHFPALSFPFRGAIEQVFFPLPHQQNNFPGSQSPQILPQLRIKLLKLCANLFQLLFLPFRLVPYLFQLPYFVFQHGLGGHAVLAFANIAEMDARLAVGVPFTGGRVWAKHGRHFLKNAEKILKSIDI